MNKRIIIMVTDEILEKLDEEWRRLGLPSRNGYVVQCIRCQLKLDNIFEDKEEEP